MILELQIITDVKEPIPHDLVMNLTAATNGYSTVVVFGTRFLERGSTTKVRFGASNKAKVLKAVRESNLPYTDITRHDKPLPPQSKEMNGPDVI